MNYYTRKQCLSPPIQLYNRFRYWLRPLALANTDWYFLSLPNEMHFFHSTICFVDSTMLLSIRTTRTSRQLIARALQPYKHGLIFSSSLMRCIFRLDNLLCRLENAFVHPYDSYGSTTDCKGPTALQTRTDIFYLSLMRCIFRLHKLLFRLDKASVHPYDSYELTTDS